MVSIPDDPGLDLNRDGIDDRDEDPNLNGLIDAGETDPDNEDSDGNNTSDGAEVQIGTDLLDPGNYFFLAAEPQSNVTMLLTWPSQPGTSFEIRSSIDLSGWSTIVAPNVPAADSGQTTRFSTPEFIDALKFYRVSLK